MIYKNQNKLAFTLVELIVVIIILAILGTIAFISLQGYSSQARDSKRISDISNIKKSLELFSLNTGKYPKPDDYFTVSYGSQDLRYQGFVGDQVSTNLSRNLNEKPIDPLTESEYIYSRTYGGTEYEVLSIYESDLIGMDTFKSPFVALAKKGYDSNLIGNTNAVTQNYPKINGNYNGVYVKAGITYFPTPSIINGNVWGNIDISGDPTFLESQVITGGDNIPLISTGGLNGITINVFTGELDTNLGEDENNNKSLLAQALIDAYSGTTLANAGVYKEIVETVSEDLVSLVDSFILNNDNFVNTTTTNSPVTYSCIGTLPSQNVSTSNDTGLTADTSRQSTASGDGCYYECSGGYTGDNCDIAPLVGWRALDSNCDIEDIVLGTQTWAGCNSTLGTGFEYGQTNADIGTSNYSGTVGNCYDYSGNNTATCTKGDVTMASNTKANTWFSGTNTNGDSEYANIWGKYYTWSNTPSACPTGRHVPSDAEWTTLENTLNGSLCRTGDEWQCNGLGWNGHNAKTNTNNLANALKLPLAGHRYTDGYTFGTRGRYTTLWSSTPSITNTYYRRLDWYNSSVHRDAYSQDYGFSVRCIKD